MNIQKMNKKEFKEFLGVKNDVDTEKFWDEESGNIFYCDGNLDTVMEECRSYAKDVMEIGGRAL